jgi:diphthamide synthase subunit DPH2
MHPKNPRKKNIWEQVLRPNNQRKRYKHSVRRKVLQIKTVAGHYANFQYENKSLSKRRKNPEKSMKIYSIGSFVCTSDTKNVCVYCRPIAQIYCVHHSDHGNN